MRYLSYLVMVTIVISLGVAPVFAQTQNQFSVTDPSGGQSQPVNYAITGGTVSDMTLDTNATSLVVSVQTTGSGNLTMTLPRTLIDAKAGANDDQFFVLVDGADTDFNESKTSTDRTITVSFPEGTAQIEVIGTQVVPEFGGMAFVILTIAILSTIVFSVKTRMKLGQ